MHRLGVALLVATPGCGGHVAAGRDGGSALEAGPRSDGKRLGIDGCRIDRLDQWVFRPVSVPAADVANVAAAEGRIIIGTENHGAYWMAPGTSGWDHLFDDHMITVIERGRDAFWIGAWDGRLGVVHGLFDDREEQVFEIANQQVVSIAEAKGERLLLGVRENVHLSRDFEGIVVARIGEWEWQYRPWGPSFDNLIPWVIAYDETTGVVWSSCESANHDPPYPGPERPPLFRSADFGRSWVNARDERMWHASAMVIDGRGGRTYYQAELGALYYSEDSGRTWVHGQFTSLEDLILDELSGCLIGSGRSGVGERRTDGLGVWVSCDHGHSFVRVGLTENGAQSLALDVAESVLYAARYGEGLWAADIPRCGDK